MDWLAEFINQHGIGLGLLAVYVGGLALNLTPCVYPMIPVTLAFFSSQAALSLSRPTDVFRRAVLLAGCYVLGLSLNYALLGLIAAKTGALFGAWLQQPAVLLAIAGIIVVLSLSMFGLYDLRLPSALTQRLGRASSGYGGAFVMGVVVGLIAAPCIGPFVLSLLLLVSRLANPALGFLLFFVLGLGMGTPYLVLGVAADRLGRLPKAGPWMVWSKSVLGVILLGLVLYFLNPLMPERLLGIAVVLWLAAGGAYLGWLQPINTRSKRFRMLRRCLGVACLLGALAVGWPQPAAGPRVPWQPYSEAALHSAHTQGQPVLIDIYADWCAPCVEMDHFTFRHADVVAALDAFATLRLDVTTSVSSEGQRLIERYNIYGAPTILFFDRAGTERTELRLMGFVPAAAFVERLQRLEEKR